MPISDFEKILKLNKDTNTTKTVPKDLFQLVVFYAKPAFEELNFEKKTELKLNILHKKYVQENLETWVGQTLQNQNFVFPYYSENVFMSPKEAENYAPSFIKELIGKEKLPKEVIKEGKLDENVVQVCTVPLNLATLENISEFKIG